MSVLIKIKIIYFFIYLLTVLAFWFLFFFIQHVKISLTWDSLLLILGDSIKIFESLAPAEYLHIMR